MPIWGSHSLTVTHFRDKGDQCHVACAFDGGGKMALVFSAGAGLAPGTNLSTGRDVAAECVHVLVIDLDVISAKITDFTSV
jgi:hypothetical protein